MAEGNGWKIDSKGLWPTYGELEKMCNFLSNRANVDPCVTFSFSNQGSSTLPSLEINSSRIEYVGGPLHTMISSTFSEGLTGQVNLCEADGPPVCTLLRDFLYTRPVCLQDVSFKDICNLARVAHRWDLLVLFNSVLQYVKDRALLSSGTRVILFAEVVEFHVLPVEHNEYFWQQVGQFYMDLACFPHTIQNTQNFSRSDVTDVDGDTNDINGSQGRESGTEGRSGGKNVNRNSIEDGVYPTVDMLPNKQVICPRFPGLWTLALSQGMGEVVLSTALKGSSLSNNDTLHLWHVVLKFLEPRIESDKKVCFLIESFPKHSGECVSSVLNDVKIDEQCSTRAMRLFAKSQAVKMRTGYY